MNLLAPLGLAFAITWLASPLVRSIAAKIGLVANPVADRWHERPTPVMGGVAVYVGFVAGALLALRKPLSSGSLDSFIPNVWLLGIIAAASLMFLVGLADDKLRLRPSTKLIAQGLSAAIVVSLGVVYPITPWDAVNAVATIFWFIGLTNAINLLDNMDGVATGVSAIAALFLGITFALDSSPAVAAICFALAGSLLGFLPYNFRPASIFMGDSGSLFIGSLLAGLGAAYPSHVSASIVSVLFVPALIVIIPILDTLVVTVARTLAGRPISVGGRDHTTHRLASMGLSQRQVALLLYLFAACGGLLAIFLRGVPAALGLPIGGVFLVGLAVGAAYLGRLHSYDESSKPKGPVTVLVSELLHKRRAFEALLDMVLFAAAYQFAYLLRWDAEIPAQQAAIFARSIGLAVIGKSIAYWAVGVYRGHWRQLSMADAPRLAGASTLGSLITCAALFVVYPGGGFSRSILFIDGLLALLMTMGARVAFRSLDRVKTESTGSPVLIYGAGRAGQLAAREMLDNPALALRPIGFLDDDPGKHGSLVHGFPVVGGIDMVSNVVERRGVRAVVVGSRGIDRETLARLSLTCESLNLTLLEMQLEFRAVSMLAPRANSDLPSGETIQ